MCFTEYEISWSFYLVYYVLHLFPILVLLMENQDQHSVLIGALDNETLYQHTYLLLVQKFFLVCWSMVKRMETFMEFVWVDSHLWFPSHLFFAYDTIIFARVLQNEADYILRCIHAYNSNNR